MLLTNTHLFGKGFVNWGSFEIYSEYMENLLHSYQCIYEKTALWDYYDERNHNRFNFKEVFSKKFIKEYFNEGCKENVFKIGNQFPTKRISHTISTFFLGIYLKYIIGLSEKEEFKPDFRYLWFLSCLFHDSGYQIENNKEEFPPHLFTLSKFIRIKNISNRNNLLRKWNPDELPSEFDLGTIENYYEYCRINLNFINHGYIGALLLFEGLVKNLRRIKSKAKSAGKDVSDKFNYPNNSNLWWSDSDIDLYKHAANSVLAHNIYLCTEEKYLTDYIDYKIENLVILNESEKRISRQYPLLFLLSLADTIEPVKAFPNIAPECLLKRISFTKIKNGFQIKILDDCLDPNHWFDTIYKMQQWLDVSVERDNYLKTVTVTLFEQKLEKSQ